MLTVIFVYLMTIILAVGATAIAAWIPVGIGKQIFLTDLSNKYQMLRAKTFAKHKLDDRVEEDRVEQLLRQEDPKLMIAYTKDYGNIELLFVAILTAILCIITLPLAWLLAGSLVGVLLG